MEQINIAIQVLEKEKKNLLVQVSSLDVAIEILKRQQVNDVLAKDLNYSSVGEALSDVLVTEECVKQEMVDYSVQMGNAIVNQAQKETPHLRLISEDEAIIEQIKTIKSDFVVKDKMTVDEFLMDCKAIRKSRGYTTITVAKDNNINKSFLYMIEAGKREKPSRLTILSISAYYGISLTDIDKKYKGLNGRYIKDIVEVELISKIYLLEEFTISLESLRKTTNKTQYEMAAFLEMRHDTYWAFVNSLKSKKNRYSDLILGRLVKLAKFFNVEIIDLEVYKQLQKSSEVNKEIEKSTTNNQKIKRVYKKHNGLNVVVKEEELVYIPKDISLRKIDEPYSLRWYITTYYKRIQTTVRGIAFKTYSNYDDCLSIVNQKLATCCANEENLNIDFRNDVERFMNWVYTIAKNALIDENRKDKADITKTDRTEFAIQKGEALKHNHTRQPNIDIKDFTIELKNFINSALTYQPSYYRIIFESIIYNQKSYEEAALLSKKPLGTVKTTIHTMRGLIKQQFGSKYNYLINEKD